jgi:hypothetical protein
MTTKVTVTTHDWPVEVFEFPLGPGRVPMKDGSYTKIGEVAKNSSGEFAVHSGRDLLVRELPSDWEAKTA